MSQERLAEAVGTTCESISEWERGKNRISLYFVLRLAEVFDVPLTVFFPPLDEWHPASQASVCVIAFSGTCDDPAVREAA